MVRFVIPTAGILGLALVASLFVGGISEPADAVGETWPHSNESDGCDGLLTATPYASGTGYLSSSERILGPYGDMYGRTVREVDLETNQWMQFPLGGPRRRVHERAAFAFRQAIDNVIVAAAQNPNEPYRIDTAYTYTARTVGGSRGISRHAFGIAVDINSVKNPYQEGPFEEGDPFISDMPEWFVQAWKDAGFCWGGDWKQVKDPMHFSWQGPGFTPGYGDPAPSHPVKTDATDFVVRAMNEETLFADRAGTHLVNDVSGDGSPDPIRLVDRNGDVLIQYVSTRSQYAECFGTSGIIAGASITTHEPIVGDFAGYRRTEVGLVDESGSFATIELLSQRGEPGDTVVIETGVPIRPDQTYLVGDYNWDNSPDLYVIINDGDATSVEVWDGTDSFGTQLADLGALFGDTSGWQFSLGDRDLDDRPDLYAFEPTADGSLVHIETNAGERLSSTSGAIVSGASVTVADYDGDGRDDLWVNNDGRLSAWMGSDATPTNSWFRATSWECPDEWDPLGYDGLFHDDDTSVFQADIEWLAASGITTGCNPPVSDQFCPLDSVTRGQMAAFLSRALSLPAAESAGFTDTADSIFVADIDKLAASGITRGCGDATRFCPDAPVTRAEMAAFLTRALDYVDQLDDPFVDDDGSIFEVDIERLAAARVTLGCNPPTNDQYCPNDPVTRGQMAAFLRRALETSS